jgi:dihydrofolate reductase
MQISLDGFAAAANGNLEWAIWNYSGPWKWDDELKKYHIAMTASMDCILLSGKMADNGFIDHWTAIANDSGHEQAVFAKNIVTAQKVIISRTLDASRWENTLLVRGGLVSEVNKLKEKSGKDIIVYGGVSFVAALMKARLIDEYHFVVNPTILGKGLSIFKKSGAPLKLSSVSARAYPCGATVLIYSSR